MDAGRELDALIAEKVFHWKPDPKRCAVCGWPLEDEMCQPGDCSTRPAPNRRYDEPAPYSTDIETAWQVVDELRKKDIWLESLEQKWEKSTRVIFGWRAHFGGFSFSQEFGDTAPHAICLAALAALGVKL